jgi:hypothetical protein
MICLMALLGNQIQDLAAHYLNRPSPRQGAILRILRPLGDRSRNLASFLRSVAHDGRIGIDEPSDIDRHFPDGWPGYVHQKSSTHRSTCMGRSHSEKSSAKSSDLSGWVHADLSRSNYGRLPKAPASLRRSLWP